MLKIESENGAIYYCAKCKRYSLDFLSFFVKFSEGQFNEFKEIIMNLDGEYWTKRNQGSPHKRKIMLPYISNSMYLKFNNEELEELKNLFRELEVKTLKHEENYKCIANHSIICN